MHKQFLEHHQLYFLREMPRVLGYTAVCLSLGNSNVGLWNQEEADQEEVGSYSAMPGWT